jgi:hypothetical protein
MPPPVLALARQKNTDWLSEQIHVYQAALEVYDPITLRALAHASGEAHA